jgi:hypothetical protein
LLLAGGILICHLVGTRFEASTNGQRIQSNDKEPNEATDQTTAKPKPQGNQVKTIGCVTYSQTSNPILLSRSADVNEIIKCHYFHPTREIPLFSRLFDITQDRQRTV